MYTKPKDRDALEDTAASVSIQPHVLLAYQKLAVTRVTKFMISLSLVLVREKILTTAPGHVTLLVPRALPALTINILTVPGLGSAYTQTCDVICSPNVPTGKMKRGA